MTSVAKTILDQYQIRKSKKQKTAFIDWVRPVLEQAGYPVAVEKGAFGSRNIVIGNIADADVVFTAHYDTCPKSPFPNFITPLSPAIYWIYQLLVVIPIFAFMFGCSWLFAQGDPDLASIGFDIGFITVYGFMFFGPANKNTANDNTSGTVTVIDMALAMPQNLRKNVAFVLFDNEETGTLGSSSFASKHKKEMKTKLLVNMDCVSDGKNMVFLLKKDAHPYQELFRECFPSVDGFTTQVATKGFVYPSDQAHFRAGVAVAALNKNRKDILYMDKIHTAKDTVFQTENIAYLVEGCILLAENLVARKTANQKKS